MEVKRVMGYAIRRFTTFNTVDYAHARTLKEAFTWVKEFSESDLTSRLTLVRRLVPDRPGTRSG
jgi:hypothetical protein